MFRENQAVMHGRLGQWACLCYCCASISGCAWLQRHESADNTRSSPYRTVSVAYQITHAPPDATAQEVRLGSSAALPGGVATASRWPRTTLAIHYPHPEGRVNCARVELIVESSTGTGRAKLLTAWLDRVGIVAREGLTALALPAGIEEARGFDLRLADFELLMAGVQQPASASAPDVLLVGSVNGVALPARAARVPAMDAMILRMRREGAGIPRPTLPEEFELAKHALAGPDAAVVTTASSAAAIERLPPVSAVVR